ncbi:MAG: DUF2058 domain-containing protein [Gammaproteobacteria bacterium]
MASLRDQMLKAGLADPKQAKKIEKEKREAAKQAPRKQPAENGAARAAREAQQERAERDRELNRKKIEAAERKALREQIRQLVISNRIEKNGGERGKDTVAYRFTDGRKIEKIYVTDLLQHQLARGQLGVVKHGNGYEVVPAEVAAKVRERDPSVFVAVATPGTKSADDDDPYAQFQVPDDLMW